MNTMKNMMTLLAVFGLVLALATGAQAGVVPVLNPSFESPDTGGNYAAAATDWTKWGTDSYLEGRDGYAGPTDGNQSYILDARDSWTPPNSPGGVYQSLGTGSELKALGQTLTATFDARKGLGYDNNAPDAPQTGFFVYFTVDGVKDTTDDLFITCEDGSALRKQSIIFADTGLNMDPFSISMSTAGMPDGADIRLYFALEGEMDGIEDTKNARVSIDNVVVTADSGGGTPATPGTLIYGK